MKNVKATPHDLCASDALVAGRAVLPIINRQAFVRKEVKYG